MTMLHPQFLTDQEGKKLSVVLALEEYNALLEELDMADDIRLYHAAKASEEVPIPIDEAFALLDSKQTSV